MNASESQSVETTSSALAGNPTMSSLDRGRPSTMFRIYCDFNYTSNEVYCSLASVESQRDIDQVSGQLRDGLRVILYEPGKLEAEATIEFDAVHHRWLGRPDWSTVRYLRRESSVPLKFFAGLSHAIATVMLAVGVMFIASIVAVGVHGIYSRFSDPSRGSDGELYPDRALGVIFAISLVAVTAATAWVVRFFQRRAAKDNT